MLVFSLPQTLPDRILRWIGAGISDMGEQSTMGRIESGASGHARMAATANSQRSSAVDSAKRDSVRQSEQRAMADRDHATQERIANALESGGGGNSNRNNDIEGHTK